MTTTDLDDDLAAAVRYTARLRTGFYFVVLLVALAGQVTGAVETLHLNPWLAAPAVGALELGGMVVLSNADVRRRLGERAIPSRVLSAGIAAFAVAFNWLGHANHLRGSFFAGMSALGYLVWLMSTENNRRDRLRATGQLPPPAPVYEVGQWLRHPWLTRRARSLAKADPSLGLYPSMAAAALAVRTERRQAAIAKVLHRKIRAHADPDTAEIAVTVFDLDRIAAELAGSADYTGLTALIAADLMPARVLGEPQGPAATTAGNRRELASAEAVKETPARAATSEHKPGRNRTPKAAMPRRRSPEETRQLAAQLRSDQPGISKTELARMLGISTERLRQVERPINGTDVTTATS